MKKPIYHMVDIDKWEGEQHIIGYWYCDCKIGKAHKDIQSKPPLVVAKEILTNRPAIPNCIHGRKIDENCRECDPGRYDTEASNIIPITIPMTNDQTEA